MGLCGPSFDGPQVPSAGFRMSSPTRKTVSSPGVLCRRRPGDETFAAQETKIPISPAGCCRSIHRRRAGPRDRDWRAFWVRREAGHPVHGACSEFVDVNLLAARHGVQVESLKRWKLGLTSRAWSFQSSFLDGGPVLRRRQHGGTSSALSVKSITPQARKA
jgi:hypothetical protein